MAGPNNEPVTSGIITTTTNQRALSDGNPIGTTFGNSPTDLISHYGVTCVVQFTQPGSPNTTTSAAGSTTNVFTNTTFTGGTGTTAYSVGDIVTMLKQQGLLA
jgi:hypothetical protein